jgi:von Willebrand factor type A domain
MSRYRFILLLAAATCLFTTHGVPRAQDVTIVISKGQPGQATEPNPPFTGTRPTVDVAILLDTSNSMDGLIGQAKNQLWKIVQQFAEAKQAGKTPTLRVSVFEYGNSNLPASENYIRQVVPLTTDLDEVSAALFGLQTEGGDEYCGAIIGEAIKRLDWSSEPNAYKAIFIAGNEPFSQGPVDYKASCRAAIEHGIVVNTIHCGDHQTGVSTHWKDGADLAEGKYMNINSDRKVVHIACPQDEIILQLNMKLNQTYLWYGSQAKRRAYAENQIEQDRNAVQSAGTAGFGSGRGLAKASAVYRNTGRDLVDTAEEDSEILLKLAPHELPEEMQGMTPEERVAHLAKMAKERAEIKQKIVELSQERDAFLAEHAKNAPPAPADTLGDAIGSVVRDQLQESGFELEK